MFFSLYSLHREYYLYIYIAMSFVPFFNVLCIFYFNKIIVIIMLEFYFYELTIGKENGDIHQPFTLTARVNWIYALIGSFILVHYPIN